MGKPARMGKPTHSACTTPYFFVEVDEKCNLPDQLRDGDPFFRFEILVHHTNFLSCTYHVAFFGFCRFPCHLESFRPVFVVIRLFVNTLYLKKEIIPSHSGLSPSAPRTFYTRVSSASSSSMLIVRPAHFSMSSQKSLISLV
jgi:hypothetical protein